MIFRTAAVGAWYHVTYVLRLWGEQRKAELALPSTQNAVVVLDLYKAHRTVTPDVLRVLK